MDKYKLTLGIEPNDKYKKAKQDLIQAKKSFDELNPQQQEQLIREALDAEFGKQMWKMMKEK